MGRSQKAGLINKPIIVGLLIVLCLFSVLTKPLAQNTDTLLIKKVLQHGITDAKAFVVSPLKWDKQSWLVFGGITGATFAMVRYGDQTVYNFTNRHHSNQLDKFFTFTEPMGHLYPAIAISGMMLNGLVQKKSYSIETSLIAAESYLLNGLLVQVVKATAGRNRPNNLKSTNPYQWNGPFFKGNSFYSGHTSGAFSVASVFAYRYKDTKWVPFVAYGLATLGGLQRIYHNRHWTSDVLMGAVAGTATGVFLCKQWERTPIQFYPSFGFNGGGLSLVFNLP